MSRPSVLFVCHGNICRSPMAERVTRRVAAERGLDLFVTSAGISDEEHGNPIDPRAVRVLEAAGYDASNHRAHRVSAAEVRDADVVVAAERRHLATLRRLAPEVTNLYLVSDFDPRGTPGEPLPDPWYGDDEGFDRTLEVIERSVPALLDALARPAATGPGRTRLTT